MAKTLTVTKHGHLFNWLLKKQAGTKFQKSRRHEAVKPAVIWGSGRHHLCFKGPKFSIGLVNACRKHRSWGVVGRAGGDDRFSVHSLPSFALNVISVDYLIFKVDFKSKKKY